MFLRLYLSYGHLLHYFLFTILKVAHQHFSLPEKKTVFNSDREVLNCGIQDNNHMELQNT